MKYLKMFDNFSEDIKNTQHINETGEWDRDIDWEYVKNNPDDEDEFASWIRALEQSINNINDLLDDSHKIEIIDIKGFDKYQGPYANVKIMDNYYTIWTMENDTLWIEDFVIDNTSEEGLRPGFHGTVDTIASTIETL